MMKPCGEKNGPKGHQKGHQNVPFWALDGFSEIRSTPLERMAGTTRLELATSAVTGADRHPWRSKESSGILIAP